MFFADHTTEEGRSLAQGAASFLTRLVGCKAVVLSDASRRFVKSFLTGMETQSGVTLDTLDEALLPQMANYQRAACGKQTASLTILSPWHSGMATPDHTDPAAIRLVRKQLCVSGPISVFTQGQGGSGPDLGKNVEVLIPRAVSGDTNPSADDAPDDEDGQTYDRVPSTLHAKAYLCRGKRGNVLFFGSANCTIPAIARSVSRGGNVELLVASRLMNSDALAFEGDLQEMFVRADTEKRFPQPVKPAAPQGTILEGQLVGRGGHSALRIEAPSVRRGMAVIGTQRVSSKTVLVNVRNGVGLVTDQTALGVLFPGKLPNRASDCWSSVLWEKQGRVWIPFPVIVPLLEPVSGEPDLALVEILEEECGWWPSSAKGGKEDDETEDDADDTGDKNQGDHDDEDLKIWTEAKHQGELDRIAVAVSLLRKRAFGRFASPKAVKQYIELLLKRIGTISLEAHLAREIRLFLRKCPTKRSRKQ